MEGSVELGYPAMQRPGVELATSRSQVRRPNHYITEPPIKYTLIFHKIIVSRSSYENIRLTAVRKTAADFQLAYNSKITGTVERRICPIAALLLIKCSQP